MKTNHILFGILLLSSISFFSSCCDDEPSQGCTGEKCIEGPDGETYTTETVKIDIDGDGIIDEIGVMTSNLNTTTNPDGSALYDNGTGTNEKHCYNNMPINCDTLGALYTPEVTVGQSIETLINNTISQTDSTNNGRIDFIEAFTTPSVQPGSTSTEQKTQSEVIAELYDSVFAVSTSDGIIELLENTTNPVPTEDTLISNTADFIKMMNTAIEHVLSKNIDSSSQAIDIIALQLIIQSELEVAIIKQIKLENNGIFVDSAIVYPYIQELSKQNSITISNNVSTYIAQQMLASFNQAKLDFESGKLGGGFDSNNKPIGVGNDGPFVQGICPNGWHLPSDAEWMAFEKAFGMPISDLVLFGIDNNTRGKEENVAEKMMDNFQINFGGYGSESGTYAQLGEAAVYYSSSAGIDEKGSYVWVRHFDDSFSSVKRYKHYAQSELSVRCFKDYVK